MSHKRRLNNIENKQQTKKQKTDEFHMNLFHMHFPFTFIDDRSNDGAALKNLGMSCYMNAAFQAKANSDNYVAKLHQMIKGKGQPSGGKKKRIFQRVLYYYHALSALNSNASIIIDLQALRSILPNPYYKPTQEDAHEFSLKCFLMVQQVATNFASEKEMIKKRLKTPVSVFAFPSYQRSICMNRSCQHTEDVITQEDIIQVPYENGKTVGKLFEKRFVQTIVDDVYCDQCCPEPNEQELKKIKKETKKGC